MRSVSRRIQHEDTGYLLKVRQRGWRVVDDADNSRNSGQCADDDNLLDDT